MIKFIYPLAIAISLLGVPAAAQSSATEAKKIIEETAQKMKSYRTIDLSFEFELRNDEVQPPVVQEQKGRISLKGDDFHLKLPGLEQIMHDGTRYTILHEDMEVQKTPYDPQDDNILTPTNLMKRFNQGYSYKLGEKKKVAGKEIQYLWLKPQASETTEKIRLGVDLKNKHIYSLEEWATNGSVTTLTVNEFQANPTLPDGYFRFNKDDYSDYYIGN